MGIDLINKILNPIIYLGMSLCVMAFTMICSVVIIQHFISYFFIKYFYDSLRIIVQSGDLTIIDEYEYLIGFN